MEDLIIKYIAGEASPSEKEAVTAWLNTDTGHQHLFNDLKKIWETSKDNAVKAPDVNEAWFRLQEHISGKTSGAAKQRRTGRWLYPLAASLAVVAILTVFIFNPFSSDKHYTTQTMSQHIHLADNSEIVLNQNSELITTAGFNNGHRTVQLKGEAFFNVAKDDTQPFIVKVKDIKVQVVGTSFNILTNDAKTEILVESGHVQAVYGGNRYELNASDLLTINHSNHSVFQQSTPSQLHQYYRTHIFICDDTPLNDFIETLMSAYNQEIIIAQPNAARLRLTSKYSYSDSLNVILENVALTLNLHLYKQGNTYILK